MMNKLKHEVPVQKMYCILKLMTSFNQNSKTSRYWLSTCQWSLGKWRLAIDAGQDYGRFHIPTVTVNPDAHV